MFLRLCKLLLIIQKILYNNAEENHGKPITWASSWVKENDEFYEILK